MALQDNWPIWGSNGSQPNDGKDYSEGDSPSSASFDYLWNTLRTTFASIEDRLGSLEGHDANQHSTDALHNSSVNIPTYASLNDAPSDLPVGAMVYINTDNGGQVYIEDGT